MLVILFISDKPKEPLFQKKKFNPHFKNSYHSSLDMNYITYGWIDRYQILCKQF